MPDRLPVMRPANPYLKYGLPVVSALIATWLTTWIPVVADRAPLEVFARHLRPAHVDGGQLVVTGAHAVAPRAVIPAMTRRISRAASPCP